MSPYKQQYNDQGQEIPDQTPVALPAGFERPPSIHDLVKQAVRQLSMQAVDDGLESLEEADDFDVDDDAELPATAYEIMGAEAPPDLDYGPGDPSFVKPVPVESDGATSETSGDATRAPTRSSAVGDASPVNVSGPSTGARSPKG